MENVHGSKDKRVKTMIPNAMLTFLSEELMLKSSEGMAHIVDVITGQHTEETLERTSV